MVFYLPFPFALGQPISLFFLIYGQAEAMAMTGLG